MKIHKGGNELSLVWTMKKQLSVCLHSTSHNEEDEGKERVVAAVQQMGSMAGVSPTFSHNCVHGCKPSISTTLLQLYFLVQSSFVNRNMLVGGGGSKSY